MKKFWSCLTSKLSKIFQNIGASVETKNKAKNKLCQLVITDTKILLFIQPVASQNGLTIRLLLANLKPPCFRRLRVQSEAS